MPRITRPQVYRVVREMLPRERFGPEELLLWLRIRSYATSGRAAPTRDAAPPAVNAGWSHHLKRVVVVLGGIMLAEEIYATSKRNRLSS